MSKKFDHATAARDGFVLLHNGDKIEYIGADAHGNAVVKSEDGVIITFNTDACRNLPKKNNVAKFITCTGDEVKTGDILRTDYGMWSDEFDRTATLKDNTLCLTDKHGHSFSYHDPECFKSSAWVKQPVTREDYVKCVDAKFQYDGLVPITLSPRHWSVIKYITTLAGESEWIDEGPLSAVNWLFEKLDDAGIPDINYRPEEDTPLVRKTWPKKALELKE